MNRELHKGDIVKKISDKLSNEKIVIGGNKEFYKRKYHLKYTQKIISNVLDSFWEVVADTIEEGDSIKLNSYIKIEPKFYNEITMNANGFKGINENVIPARYKMKFKIGERLKNACKRLSERELKDGGLDNW